MSGSYVIRRSRVLLVEKRLVVAKQKKKKGVLSFVRSIVPDDTNSVNGVDMTLILWWK